MLCNSEQEIRHSKSGLLNETALAWLHVFNERPFISVPSPNHVINKRKNKNTSRHQTTEVHVRRIHGSSHRPETEKEDDDPKKDCKHIDGNTESTWKMEWAPDQLIDFG